MLDILVLSGALICLVIGLLYIPVRIGSFRAYRKMYNAPADEQTPAINAYREADKRQKTVGLVAIISYAVVLLSLAIVITAGAVAHIIAIIATSSCLLAVTVTASICNEREFRIRHPSSRTGHH